MRMVHPLTSAVYERQDDGSVLVTDTEGHQGWFTSQGDHIRGDLRAADPHIIDWVGGRQAKKMSGRLRLNADSATS